MSDKKPTKIEATNNKNKDNNEYIAENFQIQCLSLNDFILSLKILTSSSDYPVLEKKFLIALEQQLLHLKRCSLKTSLLQEKYLFLLILDLFGREQKVAELLLQEPKTIFLVN